MLDIASGRQDVAEEMTFPRHPPHPDAGKDILLGLLAKPGEIADPARRCRRLQVIDTLDPELTGEEERSLRPDPLDPGEFLHPLREFLAQGLQISEAAGLDDLRDPPGNALPDTVDLAEAPLPRKVSDIFRQGHDRLRHPPVGIGFEPDALDLKEIGDLVEDSRDLDVGQSFESLHLSPSHRRPGPGSARTRGYPAPESYSCRGLLEDCGSSEG